MAGLIGQNEEERGIERRGAIRARVVLVRR